MDADIVVVGAGAVGTSVAYHAARAGHAVLVLEKEAGPARHQSGRNSGVIHAGYNLKPGSDKARYCVEGSRQMRAFCRRHGVPMDQGGILVVARDDHEAETLKTLHGRARQNGVTARLVDGDAIPGIEPHAVGVAALHAPEGASVDAVAYVRALQAEAEAAGAVFRFGVHVDGWDEDAQVTVRTDQGPVRAEVLVNAAGLHADRLAKDLAPDLRIIPFRGEYAALRPEHAGLVRSHVYGAPDLEFPFLGVHLSRRTDGRVLVGPGAMLALGREAYHFTRLRPDVVRTLAWPGFWRLVKTPAFRRLVAREAKKSLFLDAIAKEAATLVPGITGAHLRRDQAGNRAQVVHRDGHLVEDMVVRTTLRTVHVLNAVSPGLTASLPFGAHLARLASDRT